MPAPALLMAAEIGFFHAAFNFGQPVISVTIWLTLLISCFLQSVMRNCLNLMRRKFWNMYLQIWKFNHFWEIVILIWSADLQERFLFLQEKIGKIFALVWKT